MDDWLAGCLGGWMAGWMDGGLAVWMWQYTWCNSIGAESLTICQNSQASEFRVRLEFAWNSPGSFASLATLRWLCVLASSSSC